MKRGMPLNVEVPHYNQETLNAMKEAKKISRDPKVKGYKNVKELKKALDN